MNDAADISSLAVDLAGLTLRNPVMLAAGTAGYLDEMGDVLDLSRIGAVVTKSITARPRPGNRTWRIVETRAGMLNAIGLANMGHEVFEQDFGPRVEHVPTTVVGSISGFSVEDYVTVAATMERIGAVPAVELNMSCPNVSGGMEFCSSPEMAAMLLREVRPVLARCKLFAKLSPKSHDIVAVAGACIDAGADALTIGNTYPAMAIDVETRRPRLSRVTGGLSGPAIHPIAVRLVHEVYAAVAKPAAAPIVGVGGVMRWEDAAEFILAGASAVQMGTALFADPKSPLRVVSGLEKWVYRQGATSVRELVGRVEAGS